MVIGKYKVCKLCGIGKYKVSKIMHNKQKVSTLRDNMDKHNVSKVQYW